jgi:hypothetical protein
LIENLEAELKKCEIEHVHVQMVESYKTPQNGTQIKIIHSPKNHSHTHESTHSHTSTHTHTHESSHTTVEDKREDSPKNRFEEDDYKEKFKDMYGQYLDAKFKIDVLEKENIMWKEELTKS